MFLCKIYVDAISLENLPLFFSNFYIFFHLPGMVQKQASKVSKSHNTASIFQVLHFIMIFYPLFCTLLRWRKRERNQMNAIATAADFKNGFGAQFVQPFPDTDALYSSYSHYNNWAAKVPSPLGA